MMTITTQPATTPSVDKGARGIFEGFQFIHKFFPWAPPAPQTREQQIQQFVKDHGCNCIHHYAYCASCQHLIKDVFGD
jgi:hypothetical protein